MVRNYFRLSVLGFALMAGAMMPVVMTAQTSKPAPAPHPAPAAKADAGKSDASAADLEAIKRPALPPFKPAVPKRIQLANGMVIFLMEDHELPLIDANALIHGGSRGEPADKVGLATIFGVSWRTGGTKTRTGDELDDLLEARAARVETSADLNGSQMQLSCLKGDFDFVLDIYNDLLRNPDFRQNKIDLAKDQVRTTIARRNDDLGSIAARESGKLGYGAQSPFARVPEYATVAAVTREDLLGWHARFVHPNNMILGVTGDFDSADMEARLRRMFESWPAGAEYKKTDVTITPPRPGIYAIEKSDVNQSEIRMVAAGIRRDDPDYYATQVLNEIFGGSFSSRLFSNLRSREGLAYAVGGGVFANYGHPGLTLAIIGTKSGTTVKAIEGLYREIDGMHTHPVTTAEIQKARDSLLNSFIFEFDTRQKVMFARMNYEFHGYPSDFLERYPKGVAAVTAADVERVAAKYLDKSKFAVLVVGKAADFDKPLDTFGKVTTIDITIPQPGASPPR
ncbi:MAG TPA: pitrilysin family protein [Candidatus Angelobacter sp.]|nr:pitrilysin family protein [Candidatus Angelobacter sp.]